MNWSTLSHVIVEFRRTACRLVVTAVFALLFINAMTEAVPAQQSAADPNDRETIKQLLKRVEELEARLKRMEARQTEAATVTPDAAAPAGIAKEAETQPSHTGLDHMRGNSPALQIRGFSDVTFHASDLRGDKQSFAIGQFDLFITSRLSEKLSVLAELVLEANDRNEFGFEAERMLLSYRPSDYFNVAFGRYHTAIGYYNAAYHHGTWFQTATGRPFIFQFEDEGGILPIHNVGISANGRIPSGKLGLQYVAEIGNGRARRSPLVEPVQNSVDENRGKAVNLGLSARPDWAPGLQAGFSIYRDALSPEGLPRFRETIGAAHVVYTNSTYELLNEALLVRHTPKGSGRPFNTAGFYTQISRKFDKARPYFRYQYVNSPDGEPILGDVGRVNGPSLGLRYDVSEFAAFKLQYDRTGRRALEPFNGLTLQLAFTF
ncbi:MAG TPA: hypothetical protein VGV87_27395 [Blastocatellia bacterium]|nr:hypothetical protein [Blastocatellia bacterium]